MGELGRALGRGHDLPEAVRSLLRARTADSVLVVDRDYRIVHWDGGMESLTGTFADDVVGDRCFRVLQGELEGGDPLCVHGCPLMRLAKEGRPISSHEMRISTRSGRKRWVSFSSLVVDTEEGPYLVHLLRDFQGAHETLEMARGLIGLSFGDSAFPARSKENAPTLTPRQAEVLDLLSEGKSVKEMMSELFLAEATVRNHVRSLLLTLGAHSQLEVVAKAREMGLLAEGRTGRKAGRT
jgi:PAS domain S-box-containing protein